MQFLTRIPVPSPPYETGSLARAVKFFPVVGFVVGGGAALCHLFLAPHLSRLAAAFFVVLYLVLITGGLHEDGLADVADGFGGATSREKILLIMRDSRIGSYGGIALICGLLGRVVLISALPLAQIPYFLITAHVLCRWTALPLSYFLPSARIADPAKEGQGARIAGQIAMPTLIGGTLFAFAIAAICLRRNAAAPVLGVLVLTWFAGLYYRSRIGGITGDCFGATMQIAELAVYLCGDWTR